MTKFLSLLRTWPVPMQWRSVGQWRVSWAWGWPHSSTTSFLPSSHGRKLSRAGTSCLVKAFGACFTHLLVLPIRSTVVVLVFGFLIDKLGNFCKSASIFVRNFWHRVADLCGLQFCFFAVGIYLFSFLCISGSALFALGSYFKGTASLLPLMLTGRLLLGAGTESMLGKKSCMFRHQGRLRARFPPFSASYSVLQDRITAFWFKERELAMAFGMTIGFSRLGSALNFYITQNFEQAYGLHWTLWGGRSITPVLAERRRVGSHTRLWFAGTLLCVFGFGMALIVGILDQIGIKQLGLESIIQKESSKIVWFSIHTLYCTEPDNERNKDSWFMGEYYLYKTLSVFLFVPP